MSLALFPAKPECLPKPCQTGGRKKVASGGDCVRQVPTATTDAAHRFNPSASASTSGGGLMNARKVLLLEKITVGPARAQGLRLQEHASRDIRRARAVRVGCDSAGD